MNASYSQHILLSPNIISWITEKKEKTVAADGGAERATRDDVVTSAWASSEMGNGPELH